MGTTNICELPLNVVIIQQAKRADRLEPKRYAVRYGLCKTGPSWTERRRRRGRVRPTRKFMRNRVSP